MRKALPAGAALVSFVRYDADAAKPRPWSVPPDAAGPGGAYIAFVLSPGSEAPVLVPIGPASKVDAAVEEWRGRVTHVSSERIVRESGSRLRRLVWDPVAKRLAGAKRVLIVPDGSLNFVSFGALPAREGGYLVETGTHHRSVFVFDDLNLFYTGVMD